MKLQEIVLLSVHPLFDNKRFGTHSKGTLCYSAGADVYFDRGDHGIFIFFENHFISS